MFTQNAKVNHKKYGNGSVVTDMGTSVVVRFDNSVEICSPEDLLKTPDIYDDLGNKNFSSLPEFIVSNTAKCIKSINDQWGVFARTKIELLPHQLWICRQARQKEPCRLLVADDVGLGKTIEAGIILSAFMTSGRVKRLLILTPASLVEQWQYRMYSMFDIRLSRYLPELDTDRSGYWKSFDMVVASLDTLRFDHRGRQKRILDAEPWDLVIVDEAHHLNYDEKMGPTLGYTFLNKLLNAQKIDSLIFFTGTPHKGKNFSFLSLMQLLDDRVFSPKNPLITQLAPLKKYMIRNNKYNVTDLYGKRLFTEPLVCSTPYSYSLEEQLFYDTLTHFISSGMAYANSLEHGAGRAVMFVLITMQKLASSSVAAIRSALQKRQNKYREAEKRERELQQELNLLANLDDDSLDDIRAGIEEELLELSNFIEISENEKPAVNALLELAMAIKEETKIQSILQVIEEEYPAEQILFFTEYKATQSALMTALMRKYGDDSVTFINGDERLESVVFPDGSLKSIREKRENASKFFNEAKRRFLIATEAAGEGIDLQKNCHILFHVDLPWNPMRLHQRVGRLNRYGQTKQVIVRNFRNPDTVESRIWDKLNEKLQNINQTFSSVMEEKEDLFQLVLGMTPRSVFTELFSAAPRIRDEETLSHWFNSQTAQIGGKDAFEAVKLIAGNAEKFDYKSISALLPQVDLKDLLPFWKTSLTLHGKRLTIQDGEMEFITPENWLGFGISRKYSKLVFSRTPQADQTILGMGHAVFDKALNEALASQARITYSPELGNDLYIFSVVDQLTDQTQEKVKLIYGCEIDKAGNDCKILFDWELLSKLNNLHIKDFANMPVDISQQKILETEQKILEKLKDFISSEEKDIRIPVFSLEGVLLASVEK